MNLLAETQPTPSKKGIGEKVGEGGDDLISRGGSPSTHSGGRERE